MIPGPTQPESEVLEALAEPVLPHYGAEWKPIYDETVSKLKQVFATKSEVILMPVPGQVAVETAVVNLVGKGGTGFACSNGVFSGMIPKMVKAIGGKAVVIGSPLGSGPTAEDIATALDDYGKDAAGKPLFLVHTETSTGAASSPAEIFKVCKKRGVLTVLDAISTFGGMDVRMDEWGADYVIGYASKAIGGVFGAQPVAIGNAAWEKAKENRSRIHSLFLDLNEWRHAIDVDGSWGHPYPSSMPTSVIVALKRAVELALKEGLANRYKRHATAASRMKRGLEDMGLEIFTDRRFYSNTVSVAKVKPPWGARLRETLLGKHDIMIADGLEGLSGRVIRIGHMGTSATPEAVSTTLAALSDCLVRVRR
jgi:alanine-glyoxylate transaminase/serine-glyoxylate transaminase/serine-pyruvate transaminase